LSTIGIPWEEVARVATAVIKKRLDGQTDHASAIVLPPVPVMRNSVPLAPQTRGSSEIVNDK